MPDRFHHERPSERGRTPEGHPCGTPTLVPVITIEDAVVGLARYAPARPRGVSARLVTL